MATQPQAPFWAPRPYDPPTLAWSPKANASIILTTTQKKFFGQPGQAPTKLWRWDHVPPTDWAPLIDNINSGAIQLTTTQQKLFGQPGQVLTKQWRWDYVPDTVWQGAPVTNPTLIKFAFIIELLTPNYKWNNDYVPDPPMPSPPGMISVAQPLFYLPTGNPFHAQWRYDLTPDPVWVGTPQAQPQTLPQLTQLYQIAPLWTYDYAPDPVWQGQPLQAAANFLPQGGVKPFVHQWRYDHVPEPMWMPQTDYLTANTLYLLTAGGKPTHQQWRYDYEPDKFWQGAPTPTNINTFPVTGNPFHTQWRYDYETDKFWLGVPTSNEIALVYLPPATTVIGSPVYVPRPPELQVWQGAPLTAAITYFPAAAATPFHQQWRVDVVYESVWGPASDNLTANTLYLLAAKPFSRQWRWDYEVDKFWQGTPIGTNIRTLPVAAPFHQQWRYDLVPDAFWQGSPMPSAVLRPLLTVGAQIKNRFWRWDFEPDKFWSWPAPVMTMQARTKTAQPPQAYLAWYLNYVPEPFWQGAPIIAPVNTVLVPPPIPPPTPVRVGIGENVFCRPIYIDFTVPVPLPPQYTLSPLVQVRVGDPATLFLTLTGFNDLPFSLPEEFTIMLTRPDGSSYLVASDELYVYYALVFGQRYLVYQAATGELNQHGWWQITFIEGEAPTDGYIFYVGPPFS
jgi:hypothetical protein